MVFCVLYIDSKGKVGHVVVDMPDFDILGITRKAKEAVPGIAVKCIIPRK